jgi:hypothetical protein
MACKNLIYTPLKGILYPFCRVGFDQGLIAWNPPDPRFRDSRKYFHKTIGGNNIHKWDALFEDEVTKFLQRIINTDGGTRLRDEIRQCVSLRLVSYSIN